METVIITAHLIIVLFLIVVVLLQRSEGGGLGIGGGGGGGMNVRSAGDGLTRTTGILAAAFFITSLGLGILARYDNSAGSVLDRVEQLESQNPVEGTGNGILDQLGGGEVELPVAPQVDDAGVPTGE